MGYRDTPDVAPILTEAASRVTRFFRRGGSAIGGLPMVPAHRFSARAADWGDLRVLRGMVNPITAM